MCSSLSLQKLNKLEVRLALVLPGLRFRVNCVFISFTAETQQAGGAVSPGIA